MPCCVSKDIVDVRVPTEMTQQTASTSHNTHPKNRDSSSAGHSSPVSTRAIVVVPTDPTTDNEQVDEDVQAPSPSHFGKGSGGRTKMTGSKKSLTKTRRGKQKATTLCSANEVNPAPVLKRVDTRSSSSGLFNVMKDFSAKQKRDVIDMGFGGILDLGISHVFGEFGYWLVDNFDPSCTSLVLDGGRKLAIAEEDVVCTLGIPRGRRKIRLNMKGDAFNSLSEWRAQYGTTTGSIHPSKVYKKMKRQKQGGTLFKQNFLVTFSTVMIDFGSSRYVNQSYFEAISNVDRVKEFNWCAPILESLRKNKQNWNAQPNKEKRRYYGPLTFLMLFYLDRLDFEGNLLPRTLPTITRWNDQNIKERVRTEAEKNAFGKGDVLERVSMQQTVVGGSEDDAEGETLIKQIEEVKGNPMNNLAKLKSLMSQVEVAFGGYHSFEERMRAEKKAACIDDGVENALIAACDAILAGLKKDSQTRFSSGATNHIHKDDAPGFSLGIPEIEENFNADSATHCVLNDIRYRFDMSQRTLEVEFIVSTEFGDAGGGESHGGCDIFEDNAPEVEKNVEVETITLGAADDAPVSDVCEEGKEHEVDTIPPTADAFAVNDIFEAEKELEVDTIAPTVVASAVNDICEAEKDCEGDTIIPNVDATATNEVYKVEKDSEADRITTDASASDVVFEAPIGCAPIGDYADDALPRLCVAREGKLSLVKLSHFQNRSTDCDRKLSIHEGDSLQGNASSHVNITPTIEPDTERETNEARESTSPGNEVHGPASPSKEVHDPASPSKEVHDPASPSDKSVVKPPFNSEQNIHKKQKVTSMENPNVASGATAPPYKIISRPSYDGFPPREVKPCHGWIDEDEETEIIELTPAPLPERLRRILDRVNGFGELAKKRSVDRDGM